MSPTGRYTTLVPLIFILSVSALKEIVEDIVSTPEHKLFFYYPIININDIVNFRKDIERMMKLICVKWKF